MSGCGYQGYEFGAGRYPDSLCVDGSLYDADACDGDGNLYETEEDIPCPICRRNDAIEWWTEYNSNFIESDDETEEETMKRARDNATSLVDDIRRNRGIEPESTP